MAVQWPAGFPDPLIDGWGVQPAPLTIRSEMESGAARQRRVSTQRNDTVEAQFIFTRQQFADFRTWYSATALDGAEWILMTLFTGQAGGCGTEQQTRFIGQWSATARSSNVITLSAQLEVRDT